MISGELISVIVPVYKVEAYLDRCVQSIVDQTYRDLEIILVDDGSPDRCPAMCDAWAEKDPRIRVIHKENGGGGDARNIGISCATGELIAFVDSDDYIAPWTYEHLLSMMAAGADIAECSFSTVEDDNYTFADVPFHTVEADTQEALQYHINNRLFLQIIWNKLYRRELLHDIWFPKHSPIDDEFFTYRVIQNAKTLVHSDLICYAYRQQSNSVMHSLSALNWLKSIDAKLERHEMIRNYYPDLISDSCINIWNSCIFQGQMALLNSNPEERQIVLSALEKVLEDNPISITMIRTLRFSRRVWLIMAKLSFSFACHLRNALRIGF